jgi:hypothetical protein
MGASGSKEESRVLTDHELNQLPENIRKKLEEHSTENMKTIEDLESNYERLRVESGLLFLVFKLTF